MENSESAQRKQMREDREANTAQKVRQMKQAETKRKTWFIERRLNEKENGGYIRNLVSLRWGLCQPFC